MGVFRVCQPAFVSIVCIPSCSGKAASKQQFCQVENDVLEKVLYELLGGMHVHVQAKTGPLQMSPSGRLTHDGIALEGQDH